MEFTVKTGQPETLRTACLIVPVHEGQKLGPTAQTLDKASDGAVRRLFKNGDIKGRPGETVLLHRPGGLKCERLLLVGCGPQGEVSDANYRKAAGAALEAAARTGARDALCALPELEVKDRDTRWNARQVVEAAGRATYRFDRLKSDEAA
ncbi:MAG TPA: M17 family peptidase N-terminal domain-containing protein, partial [Gammaproteobacteria bacterium]|nr:M17 family peptidase N-terminal domain-containing protein [Gammaproteobacteria bacterium]